VCYDVEGLEDESFLMQGIEAINSILNGEPDASVRLRFGIHLDEYWHEKSVSTPRGKQPAEAGAGRHQR
jgi:hypothetical protein